MHIYVRIIDKVLSVTTILDSLHTSNFCIGLTSSEIKMECSVFLGLYKVIVCCHNRYIQFHLFFPVEA